jgi:hypothetical protein
MNQVTHTTTMNRGLGLLERPILDTKSCILALNDTGSAMEASGTSIVDM